MNATHKPATELPWDFAILGNARAYVVHGEGELKGEVIAPLYATGANQDDDAALLDWAETHPEEAMRLLSVWWATAGHGCRETRFEFRNIFRSGQSATDSDGK